MIPIDLTGKYAIVTGVADNIGFGWHIAKTLQDAGAQVIVSCHPRVRNILERYLTKDRYTESRQLPYSKFNFSPLAVVACDLSADYTAENTGVEQLALQLQPITQHIDVVIHSVAFSPEINTSHLNISRTGYLATMSASSYSLIALTKQLLPLMQNRRASVVGLSYIASERTIPLYGGGMATAKAALECDARMLAWFIGEQGHRINMISAGPYASRAAKAVGDIKQMITETAQRSPLRRAIKPQDVANTTLYLCSDLSSAVTGEVIHVDAGYHAMGV